MKTFKLWVLLPLLVWTSVSYSQTEINTVNDITWSMIPIGGSVSIFPVSAIYSSANAWSEGESTGIIKLDDNSIISNVSLDANNAAVIRLNKDASVQWQTNVDGVPLAIGMFKGNVLTVVASSLSSWKGAGNDYYGFLIDPKSGKVLQKQELFKGDEGFYQHAVFLYAPDGSSFKLVVRVSTFARKAHNPMLMFNMNKVLNDYFTSTAFKLLDFDASLNVKARST